MKYLWFCLLFSLELSALAEIIPAARRMDWQRHVNVGVPGGIPHLTTIGSNVVTLGAATNGTTDISGLFSGLATQPTGQVFFLPAGHYALSNIVNISSTAGSYKTIRGAGTNQTFIHVYASGGNGVFQCGTPEPGPAWGDIRVVNGATRGSRVLTVTNISSLQAGRMIRLEGTDPNYVNHYNSHARIPALVMMFYVESVSGTNVTISPEVPWDFTNAFAASYPNYLLRDFGFEDLTIDLTNSPSPAAFYFEQSYRCWLRNVEVAGTISRQFWSLSGLHMEVRDSAFRDTRGSGPGKEGVTFYGHTSFSLIESNRSNNGGFPSYVLSDAWGGVSGNVIGYCRSTNVSADATLMGSDISVNHAPHNHLNLIEGNVVGLIQSDGYFGSASHNTLFKNHCTAYTSTASEFFRAISLNRGSRYFNVVGNTLGTPSFSGVFTTQANAYSYTLATILSLGYPALGNTGYTGTNSAIPSTSDDALDLTVTNTLLLHGNFDYVSGQTKWDPAISDHELPNSYYFATTNIAQMPRGVLPPFHLRPRRILN